MTEPNREYQILLDPAFEITGEQLSQAWAEIPECVQTGELQANVARRRDTLELDPVLTGVLIATGAGLAKDLILVLVRRAMERATVKEEQEAAEKVEVTTVSDPKTGLPIIRITKAN